MSEWNAKHSDPVHPTSGFDLISSLGRTGTASWKGTLDGGSCAAFVMPCSEDRSYQAQPLIFDRAVLPDGSENGKARKLTIAGALHHAQQLIVAAAEAQAIMRIRHSLRNSDADPVDKAQHAAKAARTPAQTKADREALSARESKLRAQAEAADKLTAALKQARADDIAAEVEAQVQRRLREENAATKKAAAAKAKREARAAKKAERDAERQAKANEAQAAINLARMDDEAATEPEHDRGAVDDREAPLPS